MCGEASRQQGCFSKEERASSGHTTYSILLCADLRLKMICDILWWLGTVFEKPLLDHKIRRSTPRRTYRTATYKLVLRVSRLHSLVYCNGRTTASLCLLLHCELYNTADIDQGHTSHHICHRTARTLISACIWSNSCHTSFFEFSALIRIQLGDRVYVSTSPRGPPNTSCSGRLRFWGKVSAGKCGYTPPACSDNTHACAFHAHGSERQQQCARLGTIPPPTSSVYPSSFQIHCAEGYWAGVELDLPKGQVGPADALRETKSNGLTYVPTKRGGYVVPVVLFRTPTTVFT